MSKVLLGDVVNLIKDKVDKDTTDLEYYVGGEHIDGDEIMIRRKGVIQGSTIGPAFHMRFQRGDVLLMSRNPHLRKASMVDFDGICSNVSYVCRTKDKGVLLQSLLPFILQTPEFWQFAEENKKGGLPFFLNWKDFARFEFELIPIERQRKISDLLWAMERVKNAYRELIARTDDLVKSQFIEMFGDPVENPKGWRKASFEELSDVITDGEHATPRRVDEGIYLLSARNVLNHELSFDPVDYIDQKEFERIAKRIVPQAGDVLISCSGTVGRACVVPENLKFQMVRSVALVRFKVGINPVFMEQQIATPFIQKQIDSSKSQTSQANLFQGKIKKLQAIVPPVELQNEFLKFVKQSDKSKFAARQALKEITDAQKALMKKIFE